MKRWREGSVEHGLARALGVGAGLFLGLLLSAAAAGGEPQHALPTGPYPVGVRTLPMADPARRGGDGQPRWLTVEIWYPADDAARGQTPTTFASFFGEHWPVAATLLQAAFKSDMEEVNRTFVQTAVRDAPIRTGPFPLVLFSHGNGGFRQQSLFLAEELASHGYVVAAPDHPGNAAVTWARDRLLPYDSGTRRTGPEEHPKDLSFVLDQCLGLNRNPRSFLHGRLMPDRVGLAGHSFGGMGAMRAALNDPRFRCVLAMTWVDPDAVTLTCPVFLMLADRDRTVDEIGNMVIRHLFTELPGPTFLLELKDAGHYTFTEMAQLKPDFGDGIGSETGPGGEARPFWACGAAQVEVNRYALAFFEWALCERPAPLLDAAPVHPNLELARRNRPSS